MNGIAILSVGVAMTARVAFAQTGAQNPLIACNFWDTADFELPLASWTAGIRAGTRRRC